MLVKIGKYTGFCVCRRSYLLWSPVIVSKACHDRDGGTVPLFGRNKLPGISLVESSHGIIGVARFGPNVYEPVEFLT